MTTLHKMTNHGEWFAIGGAGLGWSAWLHGILDPVILVLTLFLTLGSVILMTPKVIKQVRSWFKK